MSKVHPPWTSEQVDALNAWQALGYVHEFTCPHNHPDRTLKATTDGWVCLCGYTQEWAHDFMADKTKHPSDPITHLRTSS